MERQCPYLRRSHGRGVHEDRSVYRKATSCSIYRDINLSPVPICEMCLKEGRTTLAEDVHHIDSFLNYQGSDRLWKAYDFSNLMSICKKCHGLIHKEGTSKGDGL